MDTYWKLEPRWCSTFHASSDGGDAAIFYSFDTLIRLLDDSRNRTILEWAQELDAAKPYSFRDVCACITIRANAEIAKIARSVYYEEQPPAEDQSATNPSLVMQGITDGQISTMSKNSGTPLGINSGPLYLFRIGTWWDDFANDVVYFDFVTRAFTRIAEEANKRG